MNAEVEVSMEVRAERVAMAMAEAGFPKCYVSVEEDGLLWYSASSQLCSDERRRFITAWRKACALAGAMTCRCEPCSLASFGNNDPRPRVSPDCEGTGRCAMDS